MSRAFWTGFAITFSAVQIYEFHTICKISFGLAIIFAVLSLIFAACWIYMRNVAAKIRLRANRSAERIFGSWMLFSAFTLLMLFGFAPKENLQMALLLLLAFLLSLLVAFFFAKQENKIIISQFEIKSPKFLRNSTRIVHISDLHAGLWMGHPCLEETVATVNKQHPDIIVCTGDLKDEQLGQDCGEELTTLLKLKAPLGKFAVLGNHDYANAAEAADFMTQCGFEMIDGRSVERSGTIILGASDRDHYVKKQWGLTKSELLVLAYEFIKNDNFIIVLRHRPIIEEGQKTHFDLQLSAAKHGISLGKLLLCKFGIKIGRGKFKKCEDGGLLYSTWGAGYAGIPVRVFCKPEITVIDLIRSEE